MLIEEITNLNAIKFIIICTGIGLIEICIVNDSVLVDVNAIASERTGLIDWNIDDC